MDPKIDLETILRLHALWFAGDHAGIGANLSRANLSRADLSGADLSRANLSGANLSGANLSGANLSGANLSGANLSRADLIGANLSRADLSRANLIGANLSGADLSGANLSRADLSRANLIGANLIGATGGELALAMSSHLPEGQFDAWKKCQDGVIVKLRIPAESKRSHGAERKCRCEYAKVLEVYNKDGIATRGLVGISLYDHDTKYRKGKIVRADGWDEDRWTTYGQGIHFYLTRLEAEAHV